MEVAQSETDARRILAARKKTTAAVSTLEEEAKRAIAESKILTSQQMSELEVCPSLATKDYLLWLVNDTSGNEPVCIAWAYAEKLTDNSGFLFSYGSGNEKSGMKIHTCAQLSMDSDMRNAAYKYGCELDDLGEDIVFKALLNDEQFASRITDVVNGDGGGRKRMVIASTEDDLHDLTESGSGSAAEEKAADDTGQEDGGA